MKNKKKNEANKFLKLYFGLILILLIGIGVWQLSKQLTVEYQNWVEKVRVQKFGEELMKKQYDHSSTTKSPLPILTKETESYKLLPTDFQSDGNSFFATNTDLYFLAYELNYDADGVPAGSTERHLLSFPIRNPIEKEKKSSDLPFTNQKYPWLTPIISNNELFLFGYKNLSGPEEFTKYADNASGVRGNLNAGEVKQWETLSVGLPLVHPVDGKSILYYRNGTENFAILFEDKETENVYKLIMKNGQPVLWSKIGEIPTSLTYANNSLAHVVFLNSKLVVLNDHKLISYPIVNDILGKKSEEVPVILPDEIMDSGLIFPQYFRYENAHVTVHNQKIYMIMALKKDDGLSYLVSYSADLNENPVTFKKGEEKRTDLDFDNIPDIRFTNNNFGAFVVADQVSGNFNKVVARQLYFFPFKN